MKRTLLALAAATALLLSACGSGGEDGGNAADPVPAAEQSGDTETSSPEPEMIGDYLAYPYEDYSYDLEVMCFCPIGGQPIRVTVAGGEVTDAVFTKKAPGIQKGAQATEDWLRLSINDVLEEAANPEWDKVEVDWVDGADHPHTVAIDRMTDAIDDEVTYVIANAAPATASGG